MLPKPEGDVSAWRFGQSGGFTPNKACPTCNRSAPAVSGTPRIASSCSWQQPAPLPYQTQLPKVIRLSMRAAMELGLNGSYVKRARAG